MSSGRKLARTRGLYLAGGSLAAVAALLFLAPRVDLGALRTTVEALLAQPVAVAAVIGAYGAAFVLRAALWSRVLPALRFAHALAVLHVSLAANHVLPLRLGEALRVTGAVKRAGIPLGAATASTVMLRGADVLALAALGAVLGPRLISDVVGAWAWALLVPAAGLWAGGLWWLRRLVRRKRIEARADIVTVAVGSAVAWVLESAVMWQACRWAGLDVSFADAVLVTAVTIGAQILAVTPGGIGTYEAAATAALAAMGFPAGPALAAAITAHAIKTAYSLLTGALGLFVPSPSAFGRFRLPRATGERLSPTAPPPEPAPVVLFLPARDEETSVEDVVGRAPTEVAGRQVQVVVVDDASTDATRARALCAGADVISLDRPSGLGAAVRRGLSEAVARDAAAVAFCDADGEYAPEELERVVEPILRDHADYVVGSRFSGNIGYMATHRRIGNHALTRLLRFVARTPITDGQSGYRALSPAAARQAEVIHDFNYAQVLTLDLISKGFRYAEVPISYSFREEGRSYIRIGRYIRHVLPAVHREINQPGGAPASD